MLATGDPKFKAAALAFLAASTADAVSPHAQIVNHFARSGLVREQQMPYIGILRWRASMSASLKSAAQITPVDPVWDAVRANARGDRRERAEP